MVAKRSFDAACSSRDGAAFVSGVAHALRASRAHAVLNSLSLDFIAASFASLGEGGDAEEIGKRGVWSARRHAASSPCTSYCAVALDADVALDPSWMHGVLTLLAARTARAMATSLPLRSRLSKNKT